MQFLIQSDKFTHTQYFCFLCKCIQIVSGAPEGEGDRISLDLGPIVAVKIFVTMTTLRQIITGQGRNHRAFRRDGDGFGILCQIQPELPAFPGCDMVVQVNMVGTGR